GPAGDGATTRWNRMLRHELVKFARIAIARDLPVAFTALPVDRGHIGLAQPRRRLDQSVEHSLQVECRAADDLEHVGGGGLPLQRLAQLVEQARVLDGDDGLMGKVGEQFDLLVGEGTHFLAIDDDNSNQLVVLEHRHVDRRSNATKLDSFDRQRMAFGITLCRCEVSELNCLPGSNHFGQSTGGTRMERTTSAACLSPRWWHIVCGDTANRAAFVEIEGAELRLADVYGVSENGVEHGAEVAR